LSFGKWSGFLPLATLILDLGMLVCDANNATQARQCVSAWWDAVMKNRRLNSSPATIAMSLHDMVKKRDPRVAPETLHLPEPVHARYREKLFLYRETNVLLALMDWVRPSSDVRGPPFDSVLREYYRRIIFSESSDHLIPARTAGFFGELLDHSILANARRESVMAAVQDLKVRMHPPTGNKYDFARAWSRDWFSSIGHHELNPARLEQFFLFWSDEYTAVQKTLEEIV
jgi:hypothetical protein